MLAASEITKHNDSLYYIIIMKEIRANTILKLQLSKKINYNDCKSLFIICLFV